MPITFQNITITGGLQLISAGVAPPSSDPYWANVSLLMNTTSTNNQTNNTFLDSSTNNFTVTINGTPTQGSFTPFTVANGTSYSTSVNGGSGYFNRSTDFLSVASNTALNMGSSNFTVECWVYWNGVNSTNGTNIIAKGNNSSYGPFAIGLRPGDAILQGLSSTSGGDWEIAINGNQGLSANTWTHLAYVRNGSSFTLYKNGTSIGSATNSNALPDNANDVLIGKTNYPSTFFGGYMSSVRIVKGTAVYTGNFTPPTTALTAISGTSLLLNYTNGGVFDSSTNNDLALLVNAKVSTAQAKFGTTSTSFGGDNSLVQQISKTTINSSADFTLECWFYQSAGSTNYVPLICDSSAVYYFPLIIDYGTSGVKVAGAVGLYTTSSGVITTGTGGLFSTGAWNHIAVSRSSGTTRVFVNGTVRITTATALGTFTVDQIGGASISAGYTLNGFLDDVRITKGVARYTSDFSVPTAAFPTF